MLLDGRRAIYLVEVAGRCLVIGAGEGGLQTLAELDPAKLPTEGSSSRAAAAGLLARLLGRESE
jgi:flagellar biogenesis protein FliO